MGGLGGAVKAEGATTVVGLGWGGILFSFLIIVFGAVSISAKSKAPSALLITCSIAGMVLGGTLVALFMVLSIIGGILAFIGTKKPNVEGSTATADFSEPKSGVVENTQNAAASKKGSNLITKLAFWVGGIFIGLIVLGAFFGSKNKGGDQIQEVQKEEQKILVGDVFKTDKFEISIVSTKARSSVGNSFLNSQPAEGAIYIAIITTYKNISTKPVNAFSTPKIKLVASDGTEYDPDIAASGYYAAEVDINTKALSDLNPGIKVTDADVFEVSRQLFDPKSWKILVKADEKVYVHFLVAEPEAQKKPEKQSKIESQPSISAPTEQSQQEIEVVIPSQYHGEWSDSEGCARWIENPDMRMGAPSPGMQITATDIAYIEGGCMLTSVKKNDKSSFIGVFRCTGDDGETSKTLQEIDFSVSGSTLTSGSDSYMRCN